MAAKPLKQGGPIFEPGSNEDLYFSSFAGTLFWKIGNKAIGIGQCKNPGSGGFQGQELVLPDDETSGTFTLTITEFEARLVLSVDGKPTVSRVFASVAGYQSTAVDEPIEGIWNTEWVTNSSK